MDSTIPKHILDKLEKLLALQQGATEIGSLHEAEVAAQKISSILAQWNVELNDLSFNKKEDIDNIEFDLKTYNHRESNWVQSLYTVIGKYNFVRVIGRPGYNNTMGLTLVGKPHNIEIVKYLAHQFENKMRYLEALTWKTSHTFSKRGTFRRGFYKGAVMGLSQKLKEQHAYNVQNIQKYDALVRVEDSAVAQRVNELFDNLKKGKNSRISGIDGYQSGLDSGKRMDLNQGLNRGVLNRKVISN